LLLECEVAICGVAGGAQIRTARPTIKNESRFAIAHLSLVEVAEEKSLPLMTHG
jgi:hypothetical protein